MSILVLLYLKRIGRVCEFGHIDSQHFNFMSEFIGVSVVERDTGL